MSFESVKIRKNYVKKHVLSRFFAIPATKIPHTPQPARAARARLFPTIIFQKIFQKIKILTLHPHLPSSLPENWVHTERYLRRQFCEIVKILPTHLHSTDYQ